MITRRSTRLLAKAGGQKDISNTETSPVTEPSPRKRTTKEKNPKRKANQQPETVDKKPKRDAIKFPDNEHDPIIEHLKKSYISDTTRSLSIDDVVLDQIALEGLSGVRLGRLFRLVEAVLPCFKCTQDFNCQNYVWSVITKLDNKVRAFKIENENDPPKEETTRGVFIDKEIKLPHQTLQWCGTAVTALYPVQDGLILGSCRHYTTRIDITEDILRRDGGGDLSLGKLADTCDFNKIFFVANQDIRSKAIFPEWSDPNVDIKLREYCVLEFIGRTRTLGIVFPKDKTLGRYRIMLIAKGFINQFQESNSSAIQHHLKRYSFVKKSSAKMAMNKAVELTSEDEDEDDYIEQSLAILCCDPGKMKPDKSIMTLVYDTIAQSYGISQLDIRREMNLPKFHVRNHLKNLISIKMICSKMNKNIAKPLRFYRTAYKSVRRRRIKEKLAKPTGIMAKWDEADLLAKKTLGHKRSSFSQAEDSLLILCRISSILIEPECRLSWCVHKRVIRDILHEELVESHNKTSDACLRRIKYLKRLSNNIMSINELTAELQDDPDIQRLTQYDKSTESDNRMQKLFNQVLKTVRTKIPYLLGIASTRRLADKEHLNKDTRERLFANINNHKELQEKYELVDCQSVAGIVRAPTYEKPKNVVDVKFNCASLVTMAFTLSSYLSSRSCEETESKQKVYRWILDRFYSGYPEKLISSALSKLNKRSLLTRKCPAEQASLYKPKTRTSLKLNQSVLFLLTRYHSNSLIQLAHPLDKLEKKSDQPDEDKHKIEISESNEMSSIALLASLCSINSFENELKIRIPENVVDIDQGNENFDGFIVQPSDVKFIYSQQLEPRIEPLRSFIEEQEAPALLEQMEKVASDWLVKSFRLPSDAEMRSEKEWDRSKINIEYCARLWKRIDGSVHSLSLFKLMESLLSWIVVFPGVEYNLLRREFDLLMPDEHLQELLHLMEQLDLISSQPIVARTCKPRLFGYNPSLVASGETVVYEATASAHVRYCQLLSCLQPQQLHQHHHQ